MKIQSSAPQQVRSCAFGVGCKNALNPVVTTYRRLQLFYSLVILAHAVFHYFLRCWGNLRENVYLPHQQRELHSI